MDSQAVIQVHQISRHFGDIIAVKQLSFEVYRGEIFGFLGHNGAGKTTTIRLLNGVLSATEGSATVLGLSPATQGPELRKHTGVLTETPALDERLSGYANLSIYARLFGIPRQKIRARVMELLELFELAERAKEKVGAYSKGMKQRLALARALLHNPEILFLDEPTSGLDPVAARQVHDLILHLSQDENRAVFLCTHNLPEAQRLCHRVGVMEQGQLIAIGETQELARSAGLRVRLEIEVSSSATAQAQAHLQTSFPDLEISADHNRLAIGGTQHDSIPLLIKSLVEAGIGIYRVSPEEASLEDIYFALHEKGQHA